MDRDSTLLGTLAHHRHHAHGQVDVINVEVTELGHSESCGVEHLDHDLIADPVGVMSILGAVEQLSQLNLAHQVGQPRFRRRRAQSSRRVIDQHSALD